MSTTASPNPLLAPGPSPAKPASQITGRGGGASLNTSPPPTSSTPLQSWRSYYLFGVFCWFQFTCSVVLNGWFSISQLVADYYAIDAEQVNFMGSALYLIAAFKFPAMYLTDIIGVNYSLFLGVSFFTLGTIIRLLGKESFHTVFTGSIVAQLGQPFFQCLSASIPSLWFNKNIRNSVTAVGVVSDFFGVGFGMYVTGYSFIETNPTTFIDVGAIMCLIGLVLYIPLLFILENRGGVWRPDFVDRMSVRVASSFYLSGMPEDANADQASNPSSGDPANPMLAPPRNSTPSDTYVQQLQARNNSGLGDINSQDRLSTSRQIYLLFRDCGEFRWSFIAVSVLFGIFNSSLGVIDQVKPRGLDTSNYAGLFFLGGLIGNIVQGSLLDGNYISHRKLINGICLLMIPGFLALAICWTLDIVTPLYFLIFALGLCGPGLAASSISYICQSKSFKNLGKPKIAASEPDIELELGDVTAVNPITAGVTTEPSGGRRSNQSLRSDDDENEEESENSYESTVTGMILLGFCFVTSMLMPILNPGELGQLGSSSRIPFVWCLLALPGFLCFWKATLAGKT